MDVSQVGTELLFSNGRKNILQSCYDNEWSSVPISICPAAANNHLQKKTQNTKKVKREKKRETERENDPFQD